MPRETIRVLSIEDNPGDARLIREMLLEATTLGWDLPHFELTHVTTLAEGLAHLDQDDIDVVLSDLDLPDSQASDTFARVQAHVPHLPIVVLTGREDETLARQAVRAGAEDYLFKREMSGSLLAHALLYAIERQQAKAALQAAHDDLERRVQARTAELEQANEQLRQEMAERQRAEEALRQRERDFSNLVENAADMIVRFDTDLRHVYGNVAVERQLGIPMSTFLGKTSLEAGAPREQAEFVSRSLQQVLETGEELEVEQSYPTPLGLKHFQTLIVPERDTTGQIESLLAITRDVTARKQAEETLRASEEWYRAILQTAMDGFWVVDQQGHLLEVNEAACQMSGYSEREMLSMSISDLEAVETPAETAARIQEFMAQGGGRFESKHRRKDRRVIDVEISALYLPDQNGRFVSFHRDITERKRVEASLREREEWFRQLTENIREVFWLGSTDWNEVFYISPAYEEVWGRPCAELYANPRSWLDSIAAEDRQQAIATIQTRKPDDITPIVFPEYRITRPDGSQRWIAARGFPVQDTSGQVYRIAGLAEDITARKETEEALRESERRFRDLLETIQLVAVILDREGRIEFCNDFLLALTDWQREEVMGRNWFELFLPAGVHETVYPIFLQGIASGDIPSHYENEIQTRDGERRLIRWSNTMLRDSQGAIVGTASIGEDITARKRTESALRESEERYRLLFQNMISGFALHEIILDDDGEPCDYRFLEVNPAFERLTGLRGEDLVGQTVRQVMPDTEPYWIETYGRVATTGNPAQIENYSQELDKYYAVTAYAPEPGRFATVFRDVTEHRRMERSLRTTLAEMSALLAAARAVLEHREFANAAQAIFQACKKAIGAQAGYVALLAGDGTENEILFLESGGLPCTVDPDLPMPIRGLRAEAYRTGRAIYDNGFADSEWVQFIPQGHVHLTNVLFAPLVIENRAAGLLGLANKPGGFTPEDTHLAAAFGELAAVALFNSQTLEALERSEARATGYAAELERSNQELEQFAYAVSHDLQAPLRTVIGYLSLVAQRCQGQIDAESAEFVQYAVDEASRMQEMVRSLLDLSRVSTRGREFAPTDCEAVLARVLRNLQIAIEESGAVITHDPLPMVLADGGQLAQVFQNLIGNALKFRGADPSQVHVWAEQGTDEWVFAVQDHGIGIDPAQFERIFQVFQRLHTPDEYPGLGMGLAICKRIAERHGGRIWVESKPGQGSTFYFTIPMRG